MEIGRFAFLRPLWGT